MKYILTNTDFPITKESIQFVQFTPVPGARDFAYTSDIKKACLVDENTKNKYLEFVKKAGGVGDAFGCNELTKEAINTISLLSKVRCWDEQNTSDFCKEHLGEDFLFCSSDKTLRYTFVFPNGNCILHDTEMDKTLYDYCEYTPPKIIRFKNEPTSYLGTLVSFDSLFEDCKKVVIQAVTNELSTANKVIVKTAKTATRKTIKQIKPKVTSMER